MRAQALPLVAALLLSLPLFAGCVAPEEDALGAASDSVGGPFACFEGACNFRATVGKDTQGNEVTIAVNPKDPLRMVAAAKDYTPSHAGDCVWIGLYVTKDGGRTWTNTHVPGSPHLLLTDPTKFEYAPTSQFWCTTDPVLAYGADGTCYLVIMAYQADPVTGSKTGDGVLPQGGLNDWAFNRAAQMVGVSKDDCLTFERISLVAEGSYPVNFHDKAWLAVGDDGVIHIAWLQFSVLGVRNTYYRSLDGGETWEGPQVLGETGAFPIPDPTVGDVGPAGQGTILTLADGGKTVFVAWDGGEGVVIAKSADGGATFGKAKVAVKTEDKGMNATYRSGGMPFLAYDDFAGSPHRGTLYLAWQDTRFGDRDILVATSADKGERWTDPVRVNDDPVGNGADQFFPALSVGPDGVVDLVFYDRRDDPGAKLLNFYYVHSEDGARSWSRNLRVTDASSDPDKSHHQNGMVFLGDYIDIDSSAGAAHPVWVDTRHGRADVFTATLLRGPAADSALAPGAQPGSLPEVTA